LIRAALGYTAELIEGEVEFGDSWESGIAVFDRQNARAKLALLAEVGWGLLRETPECPKLTAINEAAIATLYQCIRQCVELEIEQESSLMDCGEDPFSWPKLTLAAASDDAPDGLNARCTDEKKWLFVIECLAEQVLWDSDYDVPDRYLDMSPDISMGIKKELGIDNDYFNAIAPDPRESELPGILDTLRELWR
jgi:hypothetical protein